MYVGGVPTNWTKYSDVLLNQSTIT
ncbi:MULTISPECIES: DUF1187 family protein [unclassified Marinovum]